MLPYACSRIFAVAACTWIIVVATVATAQQGPDQDPLDLAIDAYAEGRLVEARRLFARAHEQEPNARTLRGLGVVSFALGEYVEAITLLEASLAHPVRPLTDELRVLVERVLAEAKQRVGGVRLSGAGDGMSVLLDDEPVVPLGGVIYAMPGEHALVVRTDMAERLRTTVTLRAGSVETIEITRMEEPVASASEEDAAPRVVLAPQRETPRRRHVAGPVLAAGSGTLGLGLALYLVAVVRHGEVARVCDHACTAPEIDARYEARRIDPIGRSGLAVASLGAAATVTGGLLLLRERRHARARDIVLVGPRSVVWRGTF